PAPSYPPCPEAAPPSGPGEPEAAAAGRAAAGRAAFEAVYGEAATRVRAGLARLDPLLPAWTEEFAYGRVIARPQLALAEREVLAVAVLAALGGLADPLLGHMRGAARLGVAREALAAVLAALPPEVPVEARAEAEALLARL
ncbi:MAG: carboxymuconolactone decarboxylase family protein, partial [Planctomycetia bacterium]